MFAVPAGATSGRPAAYETLPVSTGTTRQGDALPLPGPPPSALTSRPRISAQIRAPQAANPEVSVLQSPSRSKLGPTRVKGHCAQNWMYELTGQLQTTRPEQKLFGDLIFYQNVRKCSTAIAGKAEVAWVSIPLRA